MKNILSPGPWQWRYHTAGLSLLNANGTEILRASFVEEEEAPALQAVPELVAALRDAEFVLRKLAINWKEAGSMTDSALRSADDASSALAKAGQA